MRKKNIFIFITLPILVGCMNNLPYPTFLPYSNYLSPMEIKEEDNGIYYRKKDISPIHTDKGDYSLMKEFLKDNKDNRNHVIANSVGEDKLLVLPVRFLDSDNSISLEEKTTAIKNAFFGESKTTKKESVASFYNKSSYGKLKISGEVAPWYELNFHSYEWKNKAGNDQTAASRKIALQALNELKNNPDFPLSNFDNDKDNYLDMVYVIYDYPYSSGNKDNTNEELFWAYTDFIRESENPSGSDIFINAYCWSSLYFAYDKKGKVDSSTYIHEVGHLLGLADYYNTNLKELGYYYQPTGFFDLMDSNQGDHTALSKYLLNWTTPKIIKKGINTTLKLKNFSKYGDYLLLPFDDYQDNPYNEYLLLEYFTGNGLNQTNGLTYQDIDIDGNKIIFNFPTYHGLKVYHVNAKLGYFTKKTTIGSSSNFICLVGEEKGHDLTNAVIDFAYDNTIKTSEVDKKPVLYHLLESSGNNTFKNGNLADNNTLFRFNDTFGVDTYLDLAKKAGYSFQITNIQTDNISIKFTSL